MPLRAAADDYAMLPYDYCCAAAAAMMRAASHCHALLPAFHVYADFLPAIYAARRCCYFAC